MQSTEKNVRWNDQTWSWEVRSPDGKIKSYETLEIAETEAKLVQKSLFVPGIVTANTYYWHPGCNASNRRANERRKQAEIDGFCEIVNQIPTIQASGTYDESCHHVYKKMVYDVNGVHTNLTGLKSECARWGLGLTVN